MSTTTGAAWGETSPALDESLDDAALEPEWATESPEPAANGIGAEAGADELISPFVVDEGGPASAGEAESDMPTLRLGSRGAAVSRLQKALVDAGHPLGVDGDFGARTEAAVRAFQAVAGLVVDGVAGPATWSRLTSVSEPAASVPAQVTPHGGTGSAPDVALGTLVLRAPGREFSYRFTPDDLLWTAKLLVHEAGGRDDPDNAAVLWAMFNRYALFTHRVFRTFADFVRAYSTTLQPVLRSSGAAARHMHRPPTEFIRTGGTYPGTTIPRGQLKRHLDIQKAPWHTIAAPARTLATRALTGALANPGIGLASEFASTKIYFKQRHGREPNSDEWRRFTTDLAARKKWRWVGDVPGLNQLKNAFFLDLRAAALPAEAVRVDSPAAAGELEFDEVEHGEWELEERDFEQQDFEEQELQDRESAERGPTEEAHDESDDEWHEGEEFTHHADFEELAATDASAEAEHVSPEDFSVEAELESFASSLARLPGQVLSALRGGYADVAVRLMVASGVRDENRLTNMVFHARHPELDGRSIRPDERALAAEWLSIRNDIVRPLLSAAVSGAAAGTSTGTRPSGPGRAGPASRPRVLSTSRMRRTWRDDVCRDDRMTRVQILGRKTPANARTTEAWAALDEALRRNSYRAERAWVYNCRNIAGTASRSLHAYGLAVDIDPAWNPNRRTPDRRPVRFSTATTQDERLADVRRKTADTVFTPEQVAAVEAIRTVDGHQVFTWGGRWNTTKDTMHFQLSVTPEELASGLAP